MKTEQPVFIYRRYLQYRKPTVRLCSIYGMLYLPTMITLYNGKRAGQKISLWEGVTLNEEGRVVGIGYDELKYLGNYATKAIAGTMNETATPDEEYGASWSLPESFKQLTALKIFNFDDNPLTEIPAFP